ncbi:hypothetical protein LCGC14_0795340 [marine sediment metagenome]|uniref:Uncharacterized protein n=1 Tax=marine sediment metagenome TaxID=412755 RepID=A0A0F9QB64_9ZZZZ
MLNINVNLNTIKIYLCEKQKIFDFNERKRNSVGFNRIVFWI